MNINLLTAAATRTAIQERQFTAVALVGEFYKKIAADDADIHAYLTLSKDKKKAEFEFPPR